MRLSPNDWNDFPRWPGAPASVGERAGGRLARVEDFGSNPGRLGMWCHVPGGVAGPMPLVVVLHGCTQTALAYDRGAGWSALAEAAGFAVLYPEQERRNNPHLCFDWFLRNNAARDRGQPLSIRQMIARLADEHPIDPRRIFVTGLSAGGAMASIMLATYPELFAGGAIVAGLPYRAATTLRGAVDAMARGTGRSPAEGAAAIAAASGYGGPWPRVSVWHGAADATVAPVNADEIAAEWRALHGLGDAPGEERRDGAGRYRAWTDGDGRPLVEQRLIGGLGHGVPVDGADAVTGPGPFFLDAGISSTRAIAEFWGLVPPPASGAPRPAEPGRGLVDRVAHRLADLVARLRGAR